jgi:hypothetical protein
MIRKLIGGVALATLLTVGLTVGALAATDAPSAKGSPSKHRDAKKDVFAGTVTAINETQLTVHRGKGDGTSKTFLRTEATQVFVGKDPAKWSQIELNSRLAVQFEDKSGKLYAKQVRIHRAKADRGYIRGIVEQVSGNTITVKTRDGKHTSFTVSAATKYFEGRAKRDRKAGSLSDIQAGQHLLAFGTRDQNGNLVAGVVTYWGQTAN